MLTKRKLTKLTKRKRRKEMLIKRRLIIDQLDKTEADEAETDQK